MKYTPPLDSQDQDARYVNADPANGTEGSKIPAAALENPQREIVGAISKMGITPAEGNTQLGTAVYDAATLDGFCTEASSSTGSAYVLNSAGTVTYSQLRDGQKIRFTVAHANTGSATIDAYGIGAKPAKKYAGSADLSSGDLLVGAVVEFCYNVNGEYWEFVSTSYETSGVANYDTFFQTMPFLEVNGKRNITIKGGSIIRLEVDGVSRWRQQTSDEVIDCQSILDTGSTYEAGKDYHIFLVADGDNATKFIVSQNSTYPGGYSASNSRKIGGFHTLCVAVGTISGHPLSGYVAGDILPNSVWCLNHRPISEPEGMVYEPINDVWVDIYNQSGSGSSTKSVYGGTRTNTKMHFEFVEDQRAVNKTLLEDEEFYAASKGSNQKTAVTGSKQPSPDTTGGRVDTANVRMISYIGCEEMCGLQWQHIKGTFAAGGSNWNGQNGNEGDFYGSCMVLLAGGFWGDSSHCGSRCRDAYHSLSNTYVHAGARGRSLPKRMPN
ncbi:MAG: hypothetical protein IJ184_06560 [Alphaproteobacteria bacterium]|nr:hypothetical protein [Alphaproteobacteria bacterium]